MRIDITAHPAEDITLDLGGVRELRAENARLEAELAEARKQPVRVLPRLTAEVVREIITEPTNGNYDSSDPMLELAANTVLARHFREAAEARTKPTLDVEAVAREAREHYLNTPDNMNESVVKVLRRHLRVEQRRLAHEANVKEAMQIICTDAPAQPLQKMQQFAPADETLAAAVARVERETQRNTRRECADDLRLAAKQVEGPSRGYWEMLADQMERGE